MICLDLDFCVPWQLYTKGIYHCFSEELYMYHINSVSISYTPVAGDKPMLRRVFKELYPLAPHWKSIGTLLGVPDHILDIIKKEEEGIHECLRKVLSQWLKQVDPPPTWKELIEAIETIDTQKALEMKQYCSV